MKLHLTTQLVCEVPGDLVPELKKDWGEEEIRLELKEPKMVLWIRGEQFELTAKCGQLDVDYLEEEV